MESVVAFGIAKRKGGGGGGKERMTDSIECRRSGETYNDMMRLTIAQKLAGNERKRRKRVV